MIVYFLQKINEKLPGRLVFHVYFLEVFRFTRSVLEVKITYFSHILTGEWKFNDYPSVVVNVWNMVGWCWSVVWNSWNKLPMETQLWSVNQKFVGYTWKFGNSQRCVYLGFLEFQLKSLSSPNDPQMNFLVYTRILLSSTKVKLFRNVNSEFTRNVCISLR